MDPAELKRIYTKEYYYSPDSNVFGYSNYKKDVDLIVTTAIRRYAEIEKAAPVHGRLLDVGCAYGYYLDVARLHGWQAVGVELNEESAQEGRRQFGLDIRSGEIGAQNFPDGYFDAVTCWDLIEHLSDPQGFLEKVRRVLKRGGVFALTTPDIESWPARLMGARWMGIKSREHQYFFSARTLRLYFDKNGFDVVRCRYAGKYISRELLFDRLRHYAGGAVAAVRWAGALLPERFYLNPYDILGVIAVKR
jgi:2-polyprenyl-3-methyl-5-hydroxy-6-metoxy-1,4-benzoquinol methylase